MHRRVCPTTRPPAGWTQADPRVATFVNILSPERRRMLQTRALLAVFIPAQPVLQKPCFRWFSAEPNVTDTSLVWYIDGSVVQLKWREARGRGGGLRHRRV